MVIKKPGKGLRLRLDSIARDIKAHHVKRGQMDHLVHVALSGRRKEERQKATLLIGLAVKDGVELSKGEMNEIAAAARSKKRAKKEAAKQVICTKSLKSKYKVFMKRKRIGKYHAYDMVKQVV